jgi:hypothetical protein
LAGNEGEQMAVKEMSAGVNLVVIYRELEDDGFIRVYPDFPTG